MSYSYDEAVLIKQSYDEMGFFSEIKEKKDGFICEISKNWFTYDGIIPQIGDSYYLKLSSDCELVTILGFSADDHVVYVTYKIDSSGEENEKFFSSFRDFKSTPWTDKDRISYFLKYDFLPCLPKVLLVLLLIGILVGFIIFLFNCDYSVLTPDIPDTSESSELSLIFKQAFDMAFPLLKYIFVFVIFSSVISILFRSLDR